MPTFRFLPKLIAVAALVLGVGACATPPQGSAPQMDTDGVFHPVTHTLDNGMEVVILPNRRAPVVQHMVWYRAGSVDEPPGRSGIAHLLEHLMFKGTSNRPDGEFSRLVAKHGGQENAFTTYDYTGYYQTVAADRLGLMMELEADRMTNLVLEPADVKTERDVVLEERNQRIENDPAARLRVEAAKRLFPSGHPYGRPIIGWRDELASLTRKDALAFYRRHYAPDNAILVVAGDVDPDQVLALARQHYGPIAPARAPARDSLAVPERANPTTPGAGDANTVVLQDARVRQPSWSRTVIAPSYASHAAPDVVALEVASEILGGGATSRLYRKLVIEDALAVNAGSYFDGDAAGPGRFVFYASPRPGVALDPLADAVLAEARRLVDEGLKPGELARVKQRMLRSAVFARDDLKTGAWKVGSALAAGHDLDTVERWPARVRALGEADILAALERVLNEPRHVSAKLMTQDGEGAQ